MIYTFVPMLILAIIYLVIFFTTRTTQRRFYAPRTYLGSLPEQYAFFFFYFCFCFL
jgi:hypothetical protein